MREPSEVIAEMRAAVAQGQGVWNATIAGWADRLEATLPASTPPGGAQPAAVEVVALSREALPSVERDYLSIPDNRPYLREHLRNLSLKIRAAIKGDSP